MKKFIVTTLAAAFALSACTYLSACGSSKSYVQQLNYSESIERINNPDQGFYRPVYVSMTESGVTYNKNIINNSTQLYHLRIDISAFSGAVNGGSDKQLSTSALEGFDGLLSYLKEQDKNAVIRFAYDPSFNGGKDNEPSLQMMLKHIEQICPVIDSYINTVTAVEAGLIGPWGEMHTSAAATSANITAIIDKYLDGTQAVPVLVRTPKMIYDYLGITVGDIDGYSIAENEKAYRLGIFNDGYLGSETDLGTYTDRQREVEFLGAQTEHLPYGGEVVTPSSRLHDIDACLTEMYKLNLSYLNVEWNNEVIDKWKSSAYTAACGGDEIYYGSSAFTYIENRLGYRFVLTSSVFRYAQPLESLQIELNFKNVGFGNLNRTKNVKLIFTDEEGNIAYEQYFGEFSGTLNYNYTIEPELQSGEYDVYIRIYGEEFNGAALYCLQFANDGLWNADLKANKIGSLEVTAPGEV